MHARNCAGLSQLQELLVLPFSRADLPADWPTLPSNDALEHLTSLTSLGIQVGSNADSRRTRGSCIGASRGRTLADGCCSLASGVQSALPQLLAGAQVAGLKDQGMLPAAITALEGLARLSVRGHAAMGRLPPGLADLASLTELHFEKVRHTQLSSTARLKCKHSNVTFAT